MGIFTSQNQDEIKPAEKTWNLVSLATRSGTNIKTEVTIVLRSKTKTYKKSSSGDGPVDACYKAIDAITRVKGKLLDYSIHSVTQGKDALGEVTIKVKFKDKSVIARGASTDILEASAKAYVNALNKVVAPIKSPGK